MTDDLSGARLTSLGALLYHLPVVDWKGIPQSDEGLTAIADLMLATLPTVFISESNVGASYATRSLEIWRE